MAGRDKRTRPWWIFFPLKGFELTNARHDLKRPVFGDVTFLTKQHMEQIVPFLNLNKRMAPGHDHARDILYMLQNAAFSEEFHSFLAVKRSGVVQRSIRSKKLQETAENRAYEVASLLTLTFLYVSKRGKTCGLVEQLHRRSKTLAMIELQDGGFSFQSGGGSGRMILDRRYNIKMSRSELKKFFHRTRFAGLTAILLTQKTSIGRSLKNAITQSALRLADAVHANAKSSQLLGTVTAIELLLGDLGESFETIQRRLAALVGNDVINHYHADEIFRARHRYVHKGEDIEDHGVSSKAIALALLSLLTYADAAAAFRSKLEIVKYLDFIGSADRISKRWSKRDKKAFSLLVKHRKRRHKFAFA